MQRAEGGAQERGKRAVTSEKGLGVGEPHQQPPPLGRGGPHHPTPGACWPHGAQSRRPVYPAYPTAPGCFELGDPPRRDLWLPMDGQTPWNLAAAWDAPLDCAQEPAQTRPIWRSPCPDIVSLQSEVGGCQRGRKKWVPYTKMQLKELEREYAAGKFITKEKRRKISAMVNLSERQVTIWFQNRRVKEKKLEGKSRLAHAHTT
ncbi:homeobox protein Hox-C13-like [Carcharodon carcharias]|uniref:homeobox protein Hox-C13-like n=1 Tax=Carcharodon carcharias TaxID=13397 RepID=UPI001B7E0E82|nr:homeobox protein Hox-C13-like [Carcharodon carcharias]